MPDHKVGTHEDWLAARLELLDAEKQLTRRADELGGQRRELPWVRIDKDYWLETDEGLASLADLFRGRSQLLVYHFMFGPDYKAGCPSCSAIADKFNGSVAHLANHDVMLWAVSRAPLAKLQAYKRRMGWSFPWASSFDSDFNYDFHVSHTEQEWQSGAVEYNFRQRDLRPPSGEEDSWNAWSRSTFGIDWETYRREGPGMSTFALEDGVVYHTYSAYERGIDALWGMYAWLDRSPLGRNESGIWYRRHDEYATPAEYNAKIIDEFRANQGRVGGMWEETPLLLLHHTGAKSGKVRVNPVAYLTDGGRYVVFASNGGAPSSPDWYHNLKAQPNTRVEVGSDTIDVLFEEATGEQRNRLFRTQAQRFPELAEAAQKTRRAIPVVILTPREGAGRP
jgi:deazaflavin-dependent oxidoreductase (nitroreductase family)